MSSCYQQIVNLDKHAGFRVIIIDVLSKICDKYSRFCEDLESIDTWLIYCSTPALKMRRMPRGLLERCWDRTRLRGTLVHSCRLSDD